jgi:hypothetical protein
MKITIDYYDFLDVFRRYDRIDNFSREGLELLFNYLEEVDPDMELDVIAICCEYCEDTPADIANNYWDRDSVPDDEDELRDQVRDYLEANTTIVGETASGFVYLAF